MRARAAATSLAATFTCLFGGGEAFAQDTAADAEAAEAASGRVVYPAAFFAPFLPNNANDMVQKLPGFSFTKGDDVRGFGGAAGNVLIDGVRPTSKSVPLDQLLQRIPARSVLRIELIRGGAPGIDLQGQPVVANVVRTPGGEQTTGVQVLVKPYQDGQVGKIGRLEESFRRGRASVEGQIFVRIDPSPDSGTGEIRRFGPAVDEAGKFDTDVQQNYYQANGALEYRLGAADLAHLNFGAERIDTDRDEFGFPVSRTTGLSFSETTRVDLRNQKAEVGADWRHPLNGWLSVQAIALTTFKQDRQQAEVSGRGASQSAFEKANTRESIGRLVLGGSRSARLRLEVGGEGALNSLTSASALSIGGVPVRVPSANIRVDETRGEVFGTVNTRPTDRLSIELGARFEASTIEQQGGANQKKSLSFPKPRAILAFSPDASSQIRLRVERTVGQLNFKDFAASSSLEAGTVNAGNPDLEPERAWVFEAAVERRFWGGGAVVLTAAHQEVQQVADFIPIGGFDAPGNIGEGRREELKFSLTLPLDRLGVKNGQFRFNGTWRWSRVTDPVTGIRRRISGQRPFEGDFYIGKQLPKLKSSINLDGFFGYRETFYRLSEIRLNTDQPMLKVYWDWQPRPDLAFRFQVENITAKDRKRFRTLFAGPRSLQLASVREERSAELKPFLMLRARKTF